MNKINVPRGAEDILKKLKESSYEAYVVGGCVRDSLLGRTPQDFDITTNCLPEVIINIFKATHKVIPTGLKHGTVTLIGNDKIPYEITTYRIDGEYLDNRHPEKVEFTSSLKNDLLRRDFTINALAYNHEDGLVDCFGGISDLKNKIIRCVGKANDRFNEDALRMLRAIRFQAQLNFSLDRDISESIPNLSNNIKYVSIERIREEFNKIIISDGSKVKQLYNFGLLQYFIPEFESCFNTRQNNIYHVFNVGEHILCSINNIEKDLVLKLTMFFHDIGKPNCLSTDEKGIDHFYKHPKESIRLAKEILTRMKYDNKTIERVLILVEYHDIQITTQKQIRRLLNKIGEDNLTDLLKVKEADIKAQNLDFYSERHKNLKMLEIEINNIIEEKQCFSLKDLNINGNELIELGIEPGKKIGAALNLLLDKVLESPELNTKEKLIEIARNLY
nr:CCA tRNA nucleotidyltransferase [Clostridium akagii]